jgi:predicted amidohydrolase
MKFRVALAQTEPRLFDKAANLEKAARYIGEAASQGAGVVIFPELYLTGYTLGNRAVEMAETTGGPYVSQVAALARSHGIAVVMGYAELDEEGRSAYDALFLTDQAGQVIGSYRKTHLYSKENDWFTAGTETPVFGWAGQKVGPLICYDLEFPEMTRLLALQGAEWLAVSTGNMRPYEHLQEVYVQARAAENRVWVALANRVGREGEIEFFGESAVSDPFGRIVAKAGNTESLLLAEIDLSLNARACFDGDYLAERKPHLYSLLALA